MEKRTINPWTWQDKMGYVQAVEVKQTEGTLYCAGQAAVHADGTSSSAAMKIQMKLALQNLEEVISKAGYETKNIVRLNMLTTSTDELLATCFEDFTQWVQKNNVKAAVTAFEVSKLFETLNIEFEATVVK